MLPGILLLEDDVDDAAQIKEILSSLNYQIYLATNGADLLEIFRTPDVSFVAAVLDMHINDGAGKTAASHHLGVEDPNQRGIAVAKQLHLDSNIPIIFASAYPEKEQEELVSKANLKGAKVFFHKEKIYREPEMLLKSLDLAISATEEREEPAEFRFQSAGVMTIKKLPIDTRIAGQDKKVMVNRIFRREEILYVQMHDSNNIRVVLTTGEVVEKSGIRKGRFNNSYQEMVRLNPSARFLIQGPIAGGTAWVNQEHIEAFNDKYIFFNNNESVTIGPGMLSALKLAFPNW